MGGEKFLFDNNMFDDAPLTGMEEEEIARPEFTKDELELEKSKAFAQGIKAGIKESEAGFTKSTLSLLQKIERDMSILFAAEHDRATEYEGEAVHLSLSIVNKIFPLYSQEHGEEELEAAIKNAITTHSAPSKIQLELHGDILKNIESHINELGSELNKKITMTANNKLSKSECNISWPSGGIICNRDDIAEKTLQIMQEALADRGISVHDGDGEQEAGDT